MRGGEEEEEDEEEEEEEQLVHLASLMVYCALVIACLASPIVVTRSMGGS